jgi:hypothetical protein
LGGFGTEFFTQLALMTRKANVKTHLVLFFFLIVAAGCSTTPQAPAEPLISVQLRGTSVEVQQFIEDRFRKNASNGFRVESATDRAITFKAYCMNVPGMNAFSCSAIMMGVGNSRWDGPYSVVTFRTAEIRGIVNLTVNSEWCATNPFGKTNCMPSENNSESNELLRKIEQAYQREVRPLRAG